jgi:hypothetical protein
MEIGLFHDVWNRPFTHLKIFRVYIFPQSRLGFLLPCLSMDFISFPKSSLKNFIKSKFFRILESLVDFIFNFEVYNLGLKTFKKALSQENLYGERAF